jgi:hypothetical protein
MKKQRCLIIALALAGVMLLAGPGLAQKQGGGPGGGPGNQVCTGGPGGVCAVTPPNNTQGNQTCIRNAKPKKGRGPNGPGAGGRMNQTNTQTSAPAAGQ